MTKNVNTLKIYYVHRRLEQWGRWSNSILLSNLTFARSNILNKLAKQRSCMNSSNNNEPYNTLVEEVDEKLNLLVHHYPKQIKALKKHYTEDGSLREKAEIFNVSKSTFYNWVKKGLGIMATQLN